MRKNIIVLTSLAILVLVGVGYLWRGSPDKALTIPSKAPVEEQALEAPPPMDAPAVDVARVEADKAPPKVTEPVAALEADPTPVFWPEITLHVRDEATRSPLLGVEVRTIPDVYSSASWARPSPREECATLSKNAVSPVVIRGFRHDGDDPGKQLSRGIEITHAGSVERQVFDLERAYLPRGQVFFARAPGHAWGRVKVDLREGGEHEILCTTESTLAVSFVNAKPEAYDATGRQAYFYVKETRRKVQTARLSEESCRNGVRLDGLSPGTYEVSVRLGDTWDYGSQHPLGSETVELVGGQTAEIALALDDPPDPPVLVPVAGTLTFPPFEGEDAVVLRLFNTETYFQGDPDAEIAISEMNRVDPSSRTWSWDAGDIAAGLYQAKVWPLLWSEQVDVPISGERGVALVSGPLARVEVTLLDPRTRTPVAQEEIFWRHAGRLPKKMANHVGMRIGPTDVPGAFVFHTVPGPIDISVDPDDPAFGYTRVDRKIVVGMNSVGLELSPCCSIRVVFRDKGSVLPIGELHDGLSFLCVEGPSRVLMDSTAVDGSVNLSGPGRFEVRFNEVGPPKYRVVAPRIVDVGAYETEEVIVDLERP